MVYLGARIAYPLEKLANLMSESDSSHAPDSLNSIIVWYYESARLKDAVKVHLSVVAQRLEELKDKAMTDPLTGLYNRRGFYVMSKSHTSKDEQCVIAIDIDHFKKLMIHMGMMLGITF